MASFALVKYTPIAQLLLKAVMCHNKIMCDAPCVRYVGGVCNCNICCYIGADNAAIAYLRWKSSDVLALQDDAAQWQALRYCGDNAKLSVCYCFIE